MLYITAILLHFVVETCQINKPLMSLNMCNYIYIAYK